MGTQKWAVRFYLRHKRQISSPKVFGQLYPFREGYMAVLLRPWLTRRKNTVNLSYNTFGPRTPMWNTSCGHQEEPTPNPCLPFTGPCALESHHHLMATLTRPGAAAYILTWPFLHRWTKCRNMVLYCQEAHTSATPDHLSTLIFGRVPGSTLLIWPISSFWSFPKAAPHLRSSPHCWPSSTPISPFSHS